MYRFFLASSLFAALAVPATPAAAQFTPSGCKMVSVASLGVVGPDTDKTLPAGSKRTEARGSAVVPVEIRCGDVLLIARELDHFDPEDKLVARGDVVFQQVGTRITADYAEFNLTTKLGFFQNTTGTL